MKRILMLAQIFIFFSLIACQSGTVSTDSFYSDDDPIVVTMKSDHLKILQLTDLHMSGFGFIGDIRTLNVVSKLVKSDDFDLVVITGDMVVTALAIGQLKSLVDHMESLETPWTFTLGNHDTDHAEYEELIACLTDTEYLLFKAGPELTQGGCGNFRIHFERDGSLFYIAYFLESQTKEEDQEHLRESQVEWYVSHAQNDLVDSIMFMHIPLIQYINPVDYDGVYLEDVCAQEEDTGMFAAIVEQGKTKGVFVGHDHKNDFSMTVEGVYLAYGRITGYNAYGTLERGGRIIEIDSNGTLSSSILLKSDTD